MELVLERTPDDYRGNLDCLTLPNGCQTTLVECREGQGDLYEVTDANGNVLGVLEEWFGSNGRGRLAAHFFTPAQGVEVTYR